MDSAIKALNATLAHALRKKVLAGAISVLHPFARDLGFNHHVHLLITEGRFDKSGKFVHKKFIPYRALRRTWQYLSPDQPEEGFAKDEGERDAY